MDKDLLKETRKIFENALYGEELKRAEEAYKKNKDRFQFIEKDQLPEVLNISYISKRFFGKSRSWLSHKLNGDKVNGKEIGFTPEELETFREAIYTLSIELADYADNI